MTNASITHRQIDHGSASAPSATDLASWALIQELQSENKRLRELVLYLSEIVIKNVVGGH